MAELRHPKIDFERLEIAPPELEFAQRSWEIINTYGDLADSTVGGTTVQTPVTGRAEFYSDEEDEVIALRLFSSPVIDADYEKTVAPAGLVTFGKFQPSFDSYIVIELQYSGSREIDEDAEDEDFDWKPYVAVIINQESPEDTELVNAVTGEQLSAADMMRAANMLDIFHAELREARYYELDDEYDEDGDDDGDEICEYELEGDLEPGDSLWANFDVEQDGLGDCCGTCGSITPCTHDRGSLN